MINAQILEGNWNQVKGQLRERWGQLANDGLEVFSGNVDQLVGLIQTRTGESREQIEHFLSEVTTRGASTVSRLAEGARDAVHQSSTAAREAAGRVGESVRLGYEQAEHLVRRRPTESVLAVFAVGVVSGFACGLLCRRD